MYEGTKAVRGGLYAFVDPSLLFCGAVALSIATTAVHDVEIYGINSTSSLSWLLARSSYIALFKNSPTSAVY